MQIFQGASQLRAGGGAALAHASRPRLVARPQRSCRASAARSVCARAALKALIFGSEGAIVDSEGLRRRSYNETFKHFDVQCGGDVVEWSPEAFAQLQQSAGPREPEVRWYFGRSGWPTSSVLGGRTPANEQERAELVSALQGFSADAQQRMISSGDVEARPGVLRLMDEARAAGLAVSVCSGAPRAGTDALLQALLGPARVGALACVLSGEEGAAAAGGAEQPAAAAAAQGEAAAAGAQGEGRRRAGALQAAAARMGVEPSECLVVDDGSAGLNAAMGTGMRCVVTYTPATKWQEFPGAERIVSDLETGEVSVAELQQRRIVQDDRINMTVTDSGVFWSKAGGF